MKQKNYCDDGKFDAPRWLVYPQLSRYTMGWRMGYGEDYWMRSPYETEDFKKIFPEPQNWAFDPFFDIEKFVILGYFWRKDGLPKYSEIKTNPIKVNGFITIEQMDSEFLHDTYRFENIEHAILLSKYTFFDKVDPNYTSYNALKEGFELTKEEIDNWQKFKYTVCLNAAYYKFMQDDNLKQKLLDTGDESLIYISDDEWGGDENLLVLL